jgi:nitrate reductase gamma subunit
MLLDLVLFRKTWKTCKPTWLLVALFHWSAYGIIFGHLRGFGWWSIQLFEPFGHAFAEFMVETLPVYVGWVFLFTTAILLVRRIYYEKSKLQSLSNDYIALVLLPTTTSPSSCSSSRVSSARGCAYCQSRPTSPSPSASRSYPVS